jgi:mono/diheme cytochrome c family protein
VKTVREQPWILVALVSLALLAGCTSKGDDHSAQAAETAPGTDDLQGVVSKQMRTVKLRPEAVDRGKALFVQCVACHGEDGVGKIGMGPRLNSKSFLAAASDDLLIRTIGKGRPGTTMIAWGEALSEQDIRALVAYMRSWQDVAPAPLDESPLAGNEGVGEELFSNICAGCHGQTGAGYQETANGTGIRRKVFLDQVSNGYLRYIIEHGKSQTKMKSLGPDSRVAVANLEKAQIEDVITFMRLNAW